MGVGDIAPALEDESADFFVSGDLEIVAEGIVVGVERTKKEGLGGLMQEVGNCILMIIHPKDYIRWVNYLTASVAQLLDLIWKCKNTIRRAEPQDG